MTVQSPKAWPVAGIARVSVSPQAQERVSTPSVVQVAGVVTVQSPKVWPVAGIARVSVSPQAQERVSTPSAVQVAGVVTVQSPKAWVWSVQTMSARFRVRMRGAMGVPSSRTKVLS